MNSYREFANYSQNFQIILDFKTSTITFIFQIRSFEFQIDELDDMIDLLY